MEKDDICTRKGMMSTRGIHRCMYETEQAS
jgi:hypothetical protein